MKSEKAKGRRALVFHSPLIRKVTLKAASRFGIRIYGIAVHFNHVHLHVRGRRRRDLQNFFRVVAGHSAQGILLICPLKPGEREPAGQRQFWRDLLYSRVVAWGRDFKNVARYLRKNIEQVASAFAPAGPPSPIRGRPT